MGVDERITHSTFPEQGPDMGRRAEVMFHYDSSRILLGTVVRDDREAPWRTIIHLDDDRYVLAGECQYSPVY